MALFETKAPGLVVGFMRDLSLQDFQAGGILGNIGWECAGFEELSQIGGTAYGWPQWDGSRREAYFAWCKAHNLDRAGDEANYGYLILELRTTEAAALAALRATKTLNEATDTFEAKFERAGVPALAARRAYAMRAMSAYHSSASSGSNPPPPPVGDDPTQPPKGPNMPTITVAGFLNPIRDIIDKVDDEFDKVENFPFLSSFLAPIGAIIDQIRTVIDQLDPPVPAAAAAAAAKQ